MGLETILENKENKRYAKSEAIGFISAYSLATATTILLKYFDVSDGANVIFTYAAKDIGFMAGKVISHGQNYSKLIRSVLSSTGLNCVLQLGVHYFVLSKNFVPYYLAHFVAYSIPGAISTGYRWWQDYKGKIVLNNPKNNGTNSGAVV